jgi:decaprenylphospho-beta-D-erythro-pentofuranosid-2-ulose 2-reductase
VSNKGVVLILGGTSPIARAIANDMASRGYDIYLASRDVEELSRIATDISIRFGVKTWVKEFDADRFASHSKFLQEVIKQSNGLDGVVLAFGYMIEQSKATLNFEVAQDVLTRNFIGACSILEECADYFEAKRDGFIAAISSVAGDRGRQSNYIYGAAKSGLSTYLQGLRNRLFPFGVNVITIKPGFVDTSMTFGKKNMFLAADPKGVGKAIGDAIQKGKAVVYVPWFWRYIMWGIRSIPESLFRRLKL